MALSPHTGGLGSSAHRWPCLVRALGPPALVSPALDEGLELITPQAALAPIFYDPVTLPLGGPASTSLLPCGLLGLPAADVPRRGRV